jgi:hypothetical protein
MGGALGLAAIGGIAGSRTSELLTFGVDSRAALNGGYHVAFLTSAAFAALAALIAIFLGTGEQTPK